VWCHQKEEKCFVFLDEASSRKGAPGSAHRVHLNVNGGQNLEGKMNDFEVLFFLPERL